MYVLATLRRFGGMCTRSATSSRAPALDLGEIAAARFNGHRVAFSGMRPEPATLRPPSHRGVSRSAPQSARYAASSSQPRGTGARKVIRWSPAPRARTSLEDLRVGRLPSAEQTMAHYRDEGVSRKKENCRLDVRIAKLTPFPTTQRSTLVRRDWTTGDLDSAAPTASARGGEHAIFPPL